MANFATIKLTFTQNVLLHRTIRFYYKSGLQFFESFVDLRQGPNQVTVGTPTAIDGEVSSINYLDALNLDYGHLPITLTHPEDNVVLITANDPTFEFDWISGANGVLYEIDNTNIKPITIDDITFSPAKGIDKCSYVEVNVTTSVLATKILSPINIDPNSNNPFSFDWIRGVWVNIRVENVDGQQAFRSVAMPSVLNSASISLAINNSPYGSTVTVTVSPNGRLELEYSLDDITYQSSNVFPSLLPGDYTIYVKDQFGCKAEKDFPIDEFSTSRAPFFYISEANSIRWANRVVWGDCGNYKNDFNTLSCEADVPLPKKEIQQFQTCDKITTQFKSNYSNNGYSINGFGYPVRKVTEFMHQKDRRDARLCNLGDGSERTGIYFLSGDLYDYDTGDVIGTYALNGALPAWAKIGKYVELPGGYWYVIEDIIYLDDKDADVLVINTGSAPVIDVDVIVGALYNLQDYEIYEFEIDFFGYMNQQIQVKITATDPYFDTVVFLSELIDVKIRHQNTIEVKYYNENNNDIYYASGIINKFRLPIERVDAVPVQETENYNTDTGTILLSSDIRKSRLFTFGDVTEQMMWKLVFALSEQIVTLDGVYYVKQSIEVDGALEDTNLYTVKATMIQSNSAFRSNGLQFDETAIEIPALIETGTGFVKYQ